MDKQVSKTQYSFEKTLEIANAIASETTQVYLPSLKTISDASGTYLIRDIETDTDCVLWEERRTRDMHKKEDIEPKSTFNVKHNNKVKLFYQPN